MRCGRIRGGGPHSRDRTFSRDGDSTFEFVLEGSGYSGGVDAAFSQLSRPRALTDEPIRRHPEPDQPIGRQMQRLGGLEDGCAETTHDRARSLQSVNDD